MTHPGWLRHPDVLASTGWALGNTLLISVGAKERNKLTCRMETCWASVFRHRYFQSDSYIHVPET